MPKGRSGCRAERWRDVETLRDETRAGCGPVRLVLVVVEPLPHLAQKCNLFCAVAEASCVWCVVCGVWSALHDEWASGKLKLKV